MNMYIVTIILMSIKNMLEFKLTTNKLNFLLIKLLRNNKGYNVIRVLNLGSTLLRLNPNHFDEPNYKKYRTRIFNHFEYLGVKLWYMEKAM